MNQQDKFAQSAAALFVSRHPEYKVVPENWEVMRSALEELHNAGYDMRATTTYETAFENCRDRLQLQETAPATALSYDELSMEQLAALSPKELDRVPDRVLRKLASWEATQRMKPQPSDTDLMLKELFQSHGLADSAFNKAKVAKFMDEHGLDYSLENLTSVIQQLRDHPPGLEVSDAVVENLDSETYKNVVVIPEWKEQQAKQPKPEPSRVPIGVRYTSWLHNQ